MRAILANKTLGLELSADQQVITTAERKLKRAQERFSDSESQLRRLREDAEIFGKPADLDDLRLLELQVREDQELVENLTAELDAAKRAPAERAAYDAREKALFDKSCQSKARKEKLAADLIAAFKADTALANEFRATVIEQTPYVRLKTGRFKRAGGCWPAVFESADLVDALKRFLRDAAECKS